MAMSSCITTKMFRRQCCTLVWRSSVNGRRRLGNKAAPPLRNTLTPFRTTRNGLLKGLKEILPPKGTRASYITIFLGPIITPKKPQHNNNMTSSFGSSRNNLNGDGYDTNTGVLCSYQKINLVELLKRRREGQRLEYKIFA